MKYPAGFKHFAYVDPSAPKGGRISTIGVQALRTFDSFNPYILKGDPAQLMELTFDSLMARATDEADSMYGLVAENATRDADGKAITFKLRSAAKFSDGTPITADDVVFTLTILKEKGSPPLRLQLRDVVEAKALDPATVRFIFKGEEVRKLPLVVAGLPILSKAYYATREFDQTTLEPPLGSGPYKIGDFKQGTHLTYKRREDYWGKDLPVNIGRWNFDEVRIEYYRDRTPELEALKAGVIDLREEFTARDWVTGYDFPAVKDGRVLRATLPDSNPSGAQGWFFNTRRPKFQDTRVRQALDLAFDYEWTNKNIFSGLYTRTASFFENSDMKASGKPSPEELALLEPFKAQLPSGVFGEPVVPHVSDGSGNDRKNLREAVRLLEESGFAIKDGKRTNAKGEILDIEFLITDVSSERILGPYVKNLNAIGIQTSIRRIDQAQYERRRKSYDYDVLSARFVIGLTPGPEVKNLWSSEAAKNDGSFNLAGIQSPAVDGLIGKITEAKTRADLLIATRALDRVLRAGHYWVPQWFKAAHHIAHWDKFGRPATKPLYDRGIIDTWWYDAEKSAKLKTN